MFETFVDPSKADEEQLSSLVAYALYKRAKREWASEFYKVHKCRPTEQQRSDYVATWSPTVIETTRNTAESVLASYADTVVEAAIPGVLKDALKGSFWRDVGVGIVSAFCYTLLLIVIAVVLKFSGIDLLELLKRFSS